VIKVFKSRAIRELLSEEELDALVEDFRKYKEEGMQPDTFGRDVPYDHPHTLPSVRVEEVRHLHLMDETSQWSVRTVQYSRTSDTHLVYCSGAFNEEHFLLITILGPEAHSQARNNDIMSALSKQAEVFRNKH
jgi:mRNA interferase YafO